MTMDGLVHTRGPFKHSWWRILLIVSALLVFILTCIFNGLSSTGANGKQLSLVYVIEHGLKNFFVDF